MNEKEYEKFLGDVGKEISVLVARNRSLAMSRFHDQCAKFCEKENVYLEAVGKAQREAERNPQLRDYKDGTPPKDGWEWVYFSSTARFWSEPLPFSPDAWVSNYYGPSVLSFSGFDDEAKEPNREDMIMCEYVVLGLIHDEFIKVPVSDRLCSIDDGEWRRDTWDKLQLRNSRLVFEQGERVKARLEKALENVKSDLKPTETGQKATPAKCRWIKDCLWKLYEKTLKVIVDAVLERMWPK